MADNSNLPLTGSGDATLVVAMDDISGVKYQRAKIAWGVDGAAVDASASDPLPVNSELTTGDLDTGAGTDTRAVVGLVYGASGGGVLASLTNPFPVTIGGGVTPYSLLSANSTNTTSVKASAAKLHSLYLSNTGVTVAYVKIYDKASAPNLASDVPVLRFLVPANGAAAHSLGNGYTLTLGLAFAIVGLAPNTDTTVVAANQVIVNCGYL